mmetsp:Transcript_25167/g.76362  ORF Transcript_25167/g.76362 Transcript_25167/m.76362 type:complete len:233 (+) Transcript_25167:374-1072(+)
MGASSLVSSCSLGLSVSTSAVSCCTNPESASCADSGAGSGACSLETGTGASWAGSAAGAGTGSPESADTVVSGAADVRGENMGAGSAPMGSSLRLGGVGPSRTQGSCAIERRVFCVCFHSWSSLRASKFDPRARIRCMIAWFSRAMRSYSCLRRSILSDFVVGGDFMFRYGFSEFMIVYILLRSILFWRSIAALRSAASCSFFALFILYVGLTDMSILGFMFLSRSTCFACA